MKREQISNERIIKAIKESYGIITNTARRLKVSRQALHEWINEDEELKNAVKHARENDLKDLIEDALVKNIKKGKEASIIFASKTQLRNRGYQERIEVTDKSKLDDQIQQASESDLMEMMAKLQKKINDAT
jgi:hypothetical protein